MTAAERTLAVRRPLRELRPWFLAAVLFIVNAVVCWPLFLYEFLDNLLSIEGLFISIARYLLVFWPDHAWFSWWNAGMPFENAYLPFAPAVTAVFSTLTGWPVARAYHWLLGFFYCLTPVALYFFAGGLSGSGGLGFAAGLIYSVASPALLIPVLRADAGAFLSPTRLRNMVVYGEGPHNIALALLPFALLLVFRSFERCTIQRLAVAALATSAVFLTNAFGMVAMATGAFVLAVVTHRAGLVRQVAIVMGILGAAYVLSCRFLTPSVVHTIIINSQVSGGDYRFSARQVVFQVLFVACVALLLAICRSTGEPATRFAVMFTFVFGCISILGGMTSIAILPQPLRYHLELDMGAAMLCACGARYAYAQLRPRWRTPVFAGIGAVLLVFFSGVVQQARAIARPLEIRDSVQYRQAVWLDTHFPDQRIMVSGDTGFWFNLFSNNPQLSGGHEPTAPNWMQRVAVYTIYSGANAGARDGQISVFWLKVFGCSAITVPGPNSREHYHPIVTPNKFAGLLPLRWESEDDRIFSVPRRSASLAHVVPRESIPTRTPLHGLDLEPALKYAAALEDSSLPVAALRWQSPTRGRISTSLTPGQVISVQITHDDGWIAHVDGKPRPVRRDALGFMVIDPECAGACDIELLFIGSKERRICGYLSLGGTGAILAGLLFPPIWSAIQRIRRRFSSQ